MDRNGLKKKYSGTNIRKFFMAREILKIKTYVDGKNDLPFPSAEEQIGITEYTYTSKRMGNVTLSARLMHRRCLDKLWTGLQYVEFRGEKYFISATPSSGKDNEDARYEHTLSFIPERDLKLNNVYFYDAVSEESTGDDKYKSNSTNVVFFGTIEEFVARLNESLKYSGLDYTVVIDEGITSEAKLMSFEDQFFFSVLQEIYNTYELPFYFVGKVIHIGFTSNAITQTFKYGFDNELLSIKKNNANYRIINRCTGIGSEDNIPYYYPNRSPKGDIEAVAGAANSGIMQEDITISDPEKFASSMDINGSIRFIGQSVGEIKYGTSPNTGLVSDITQLEAIVGVRQGGDDHAQIYITASVTKPGLMKFPLNVIVEAMHEMPLNKTFAAKCDIYADDDYYNFHDDAGSSFSNDGTSFVTGKLLGMDTGTTLYIKTSKAGALRVVIQVNVTISASRRTNMTGASEEQDTSSGFYYGKVKFSNGISMSGNGVWTSGEDADGNIIEVVPKDLGLSLNGTPADGDTITQTLVRYITPSKYLMPPVYRESLGAERFYNALNEKYTNPDTGEKYIFENVYDPAIPREHKQEFKDIKPTIKGMTNAAGQRMDQILDIAFDLDDNDEVDEEGKYLHPYFFVKLPKYDGDYGFNLFDHAIDEEEMSVSMTSGQCGACEFIIGVSDDEAQRNLVQVDSSGNLLRDSDGNVRCGREGMPEESPQDRQNDTENYEVWIALKKEESTYGQIMPNVQQNLKPAQGDTFVILHIDLPQAYILNAENELKEAIIKYMAQNNSEKFNFSITFSRIYLEEHPDIESQLNENARIQVEYDGVKYEFYISQYTYKCLDEESLPEISVEITDTITVNRTVLQNTADAIMNNMNSAIGNIDFLMQGLRYFIRKDVDDVALGRIVFRQGVLFGNFKSGFLGSGGAVLIDENGSSHAEFDFLTVRRKAVFKELTVEELTHAGGQIIVSPASMVCSDVQDMGDSYRCFFETKGSDGETIYNQFDIDDQARCQTFNKWGNRYYWRLVVGVGENYIDLSKTDMDSGSDIPQAGDRIVQLGNRNDTTRQAAQIISCFGENSPSYVMYNGINSYSLVDKNITGIIYNQQTQEPQMYSYGSFYFGDRDISASDATFITYQQREGETKKKVFIQADVKLGPGSSGLGNLDEWGDLDQSIKDLAQEAQQAQKAAEDAQKTADDAQKEIDGWVADGVISPLEKQGLKDEFARIKADYQDVQSGYNKYGLGNPTDYNLAYAEYYNVLSEILSSPEQNVPVPSNFDTIQDTYYDRWVDALEAIAAAAKTAVTNAQESANDAQQTASEALLMAQESKDYIDNTLPDEIANINKKLDGVVETWFYPYSPTLSNEPAATWIKDGEQEKHIGDMFLNNQEYVDDETTPDAGKAWRWEKNTSGDYFWNQVADSDAVKALQDAAKAQDTADQKRRVFVTTPYPPYDVGDMWTQGPSGDIMRCIKARATGSYTASDWDKASKYTDDTVAQDALDKAQQAQDAADKAQDVADAAQAAASKAQNTADSAVVDASEANKQLTNLMSDSVITPPEKTALKQQHSDIKAEYSQIISDAQKYGVSTSAYTSAYNSANTALTKYTAASPENITVGSDYNNISAYYTARQTILNAIAAAAKKVADDAQSAADDAQDAADAAQNTANQAAQDASKAMQDAAAAQAAVQSVRGDLNNLNDTVSDLDEYIDGAFRDGVIDSAESIAIQKYLNVVNESWSDVQGSYTTVYNNPYLTGSAKTNLNSAYNTLSQRRTTLVNRINTAVSNPSTTNINNMNSAFDSYNTAMQQFRVELENANEAIQEQTNLMAKLLASASMGKMLYDDPEFKNGTNSITKYYSSGSSLVTIARKQITNIPNSSGYGLEIVSLADNDSESLYPGRGGFTFSTRTKANQMLLCRFIAKVPEGRIVQFNSNPTGNNTTRMWLTEHIGTGNWEEYAFYVKAGDSGTFSTTFYFFIDGSDPVTWYISYATVFDLSSASDLIERMSDIEYLETVFPNSNLISEGALIGRMVGVTDRSPSESGAKVVAGLNGTSTGSDTTYGKALIFAGSDGVTDSAIKNSTTIIYESGRIKSKDVDLEGKISATSGQIGKLKIDSEGWLLSSSENTSMALNADAFNINNKGYKNYEASFNIRTIFSSIIGTNDNTFVNIKQDRVDSSLYGKYVQNVALNVSAAGASTGFHLTNGSQRPYRFDGNFAIRCAAGMFAGLRPMTRRIPGINGTTTYDDEEYLTRDDCIIICRGTNISINIYLPGNTSDPESEYYLQNGQYYQIWMTGTAQRVIRAQGGRVINWTGIQTGSTQTLGTTDYRVVHLVYCEQESQWLMFAPPRE